MKYFVCILLSVFILSCQQDNAGTSVLSRHDLSVRHTVLSTDLSTNTSRLQWLIKNNGAPLNNDGWHIYFGQIAMTPDQSTIPSTVKIENVKGDLQRLGPGTDFKSLNSGDSLVVEFTTKYPILRQSFLPASLYIAYPDGAAFPLTDVQYTPFSNEIRESLGAPTPADIYAQNEGLSMLPEFNLVPVLPRPKSIIRNGTLLHYNGRVNIVYDAAFKKGAEQLKEYLSSVFTGTVNLKSSASAGQNDGIFLIKLPDQSRSNDYYKLDVASSGISIVASHEQGLFYGIQSLRQLIDIRNWKNPSDRLSIKNAKIIDEPRFDYRGLMLDVSRNFHRKETVLEILDLMALYKLNKFHFHLTDDEGWRLEIDGLPELTSIASKRGHTLDERDHTLPFYSSGPDPENSYGSGFYTKEDFIEILQYATARHIEVIPEIDLPGHMRAAIRAMTARYYTFMEEGETGNVEAAHEYLLEDFEDESAYSSAQGYGDNALCVCQESSFRFVEKVIDEVAKLYAAADAPFKTFHSGGDEVAYGAWQKSPVCEEFIKTSAEVNSTDDLHAYTIKRLKTILAKYNLVSAGWEEILLRSNSDGHNTTEINPEFVEDKVQAYVWNAIWGGGREEMAYKLANMGYPIVICNSAQLYLDMAYNKDPDEFGLSWSGYTNTKSAFDLVPYDLYKTAKVDDINSFVKGKTALTEEGKQNILGIQGQIWSETLRDEETLYYMMLPKLLSVAERAWSAAKPWESAAPDELYKQQRQDWNGFANLVGQVELPKLDAMGKEGLPYRIPRPGAIKENNMFKANVLFPGLQIRYTVDGTEPTKQSSLYVEPVGVGKKEVRAKAYTSTGRGSRVSIVK